MSFIFWKSTFYYYHNWYYQVKENQTFTIHYYHRVQVRVQCVQWVQVTHCTYYSQYILLTAIFININN